MPFFLLVLFVLTGSSSAWSQSRFENSWSMNVGIGWSSTAISDPLLNHYRYSGNSFRYVKIEGTYIDEKHQLQIGLTANKSQLYPVNINPLYYEYNNLKSTVGELRLSYFYGLTTKQGNFNVYAGGCNASVYTVQNQFYHNLLYPFGPGHRKSYLVAPLNIMPSISLEYAKGRMMANTSFGYGIVNLSVRPNDNYVKQIDVDYKQRWQLSLPNQFSSFRYSVLCHYNFKKLGVSLNYDLNYNEISNFKSLHSIILAGINILL